MPLLCSLVHWKVLLLLYRIGHVSAVRGGCNAGRRPVGDGCHHVLSQKSAGCFERSQKEYLLVPKNFQTFSASPAKSCRHTAHVFAEMLRCRPRKAPSGFLSIPHMHNVEGSTLFILVLEIRPSILSSSSRKQPTPSAANF